MAKLVGSEKTGTATVTKGEDMTTVELAGLLYAFDRRGQFVGATHAVTMDEWLSPNPAAIAKARRAHDKAWANGR